MFKFPKNVRFVTIIVYLEKGCVIAAYLFYQVFNCIWYT